MAILEEKRKVMSGGREWAQYKMMNDQSADETASDEINIEGVKELTLMVESGAGVSNGVVKLETAATTGGPYYVCGTVTTNAASSAFADTVSAGDAGLPARFARCRIETVITGGTIDAYLVTQT